VIDEIGPLELRGEGFCDVLKKVLTVRRKKMILVVRKGLAEKIKEYFGISAIEINFITDI
jgi:nucleoside-triphosphatase THEP1